MELLTPEHEPDPAAMGGKGAALVSAARAGFAVPPFFVVPAAAADRELSGAETTAVRGALARLGTDRFAVRSSAVGEDGAEHAFAGQLDSFLNVAAEDVPGRIAEVRASGAGERASAYAEHHGIGGDGGDAAPLVAVVVQAMADADAAGVAFSADPVSGRRGLAVVSAVAGLGEALVSGEAEGRTWRVDRRGVVTADGSADRIGPELDDATVRGIATLARACAAHFGRPQDVEWALAGGRLHLLQSRPVTALAGRPDPDAPAELWDNSNIAESYGGLTGALTFSFARRVHAEVYRSFCSLLAVDGGRIAASADVSDLRDVARRRGPAEHAARRRGRHRQHRAGPADPRAG